VSIHLKSVSQTGLDDSLTPLHLFDESMCVGKQVVIDIPDVSGNDRPEQQTSESGSRICGENHVAERDPSRRSQWSRMPYLQFSEEHEAS